jgi:uncharacterized protein YndB with AHSA1/START domain
VVPKTARSRTIAADPEQVWKVVADPHHLPRWWPKVRRVEDVRSGAWTKVFMTERGRPVRADFELLESRRLEHLAWRQEIADSPFERVLDESVTEVRLEPAGEGTAVTIELRQKLRGLARLGPFLVRRGARRLLDEALEGLERCTAR